MAQERADIETHVDAALQEILGYAPSAEEDLTDAMDSIQRLELLISLEERLGASFQDDAVDRTWWANRNDILALVTEAIAPAHATEPR